MLAVAGCVLLVVVAHHYGKQLSGDHPARSLAQESPWVTLPCEGLAELEPQNGQSSLQLLSTLAGAIPFGQELSLRCGLSRPSAEEYKTIKSRIGYGYRDGRLVAAAVRRDLSGIVGTGDKYDEATRAQIHSEFVRANEELEAFAGSIDARGPYTGEVSLRHRGNITIRTFGVCGGFPYGAIVIVQRDLPPM